jgi:hypothetical protein
MESFPGEKNEANLIWEWGQGLVDNEEFQQIVPMGLTLSTQDAVGRNFTMQIGSVIQSITLTASGEQVNISPAVGTLVKPAVRGEPAAQRPQLPVANRPYAWRGLRAGNPSCCNRDRLLLKITAVRFLPPDRAINTRTASKQLDERVVVASLPQTRTPTP